MLLDLDRILKSDIPHRIVKRAGLKLKSEQYFMPSKFFRQLTDHDSEILGEWASVVSDVDLDDCEKANEYSQLILLSQILAMAEGVYIESDDGNYQAIKRAVIMCIANNLHRKGLVKCYYDNLTFGDEGLDLKIMERLDDE